MMTDIDKMKTQLTKFRETWEEPAMFMAIAEFVLLCHFPDSTPIERHQAAREALDDLIAGGV